MAAAIESVLKQTYQNIEILVVDDGSRDNTEKIAKRYPVQYIHQIHQGVATARNNGIRASNGEFFICLDADDKLLPKHLEKTVKVMLENPKIGFVLTGSKIWNEELKIENIWMPQKIYHKYSLHTGWKGFPGCALFRRAAFDSLEYGFDSGLPAMEDLDVCLRILREGWKVKTVFEPLHWHRIHKGSLDPKDPQKRKEAEVAISRKYGFRKPYRTLSALYQRTLGAFTSLISHPIEYLKSIKRKTTISIWMRSHHWVNSVNKEKAYELVKEILMTNYLLINWSHNKQLQKYYKEKIRSFELQLQGVINSDAIAGSN